MTFACMNFGQMYSRCRKRRLRKGTVAVFAISHIAVQLLLWPLPWWIRRKILAFTYGWEVASDARIGLSVILARRLVMKSSSGIGHLNFIRVDDMTLGICATIGHLNWISGFPKNNSSAFGDATERQPRLGLLDHAAITNRHRFDCTDEIEIGRFTTFAGWNSQVLTHSIEIEDARQHCAPVRIGAYCFVGTQVVILKGARLPDFSVLGAGSILAHAMTDTYTLYSGVPARPIRQLDATSRYFSRAVGFCS
jgi:acetyltransferase-like isoleucine patch superfamily enzyme